MKKGLLILFLAVSAAVVAQKDTLITLGDDVVSSSEFLAVYNKNKDVGKDIDPKTPEEYLELYVNFKLKVKEAMEMGMDTLPKFKREFGGYRAQLAKPYLVDKKADEVLIEEAYERMQYEVRAGHIMMDLSADALPADTLEVYNKMMKLRKEILSGASFEDKAREISTDTYSARNGGDLGYFTVFNMVYPFESAAYQTEVGSVSKPVRSQFGYHLIKVYDKRAARGKVKVAHIFLISNDKTADNKKEEVEARIKEIYSQLQSGAEFELLVKQYSDDKKTIDRGGELPVFGLNEMFQEFEDQAYALENQGDYSEPFKTEIGWHIIKLVDKYPIAGFEESKDEIAQKVNKDQRSSMGVKSLIAKLKKEYNFKEYPKRLKDVYKVVDQSYMEGTWDPEKAAGLEKTLFVLNGLNYTQSDFARYLDATQRSGQKSKTVEQEVYKQYNNWINSSVIAYEDSQLEKKYPEFRLLVNEYHDGILLFDLTEEKIWNYAAKDSAGLYDFHQENKGKYMWGKRVNATIYSCSSVSVANKIAKSAGKGMSEEKILEKYNKESELTVISENGKFSKGQSKLVDAVDWTVGVSKIIEEDERAKFVVISEVLEPAPKELDEARGLVISDYQKELEQEWIEELRAKYTVKVNEPLFRDITKDIE